MANAKRWYDQDEQLSSAVDLLAVFPMAIQSIIAEGASQLAEREFKADELLKQVRSLGAERVLALFKSKKKQRVLDNNPQVHKIINYLMLLTPVNRRLLGMIIVDLTDLTREYLTQCQNFQQKAELTQIERMKKTYVSQGKAYAAQYLKELRVTFLQEIELKSMDYTCVSIDEALIKSTKPSS